MRELLWHLHWRGVARSCVVFYFKHFDCGFVNSKCFVCAFFFPFILWKELLSVMLVFVRIIYKMVYSNWRAEGAQVC